MKRSGKSHDETASPPKRIPAQSEGTAMQSGDSSKDATSGTKGHIDELPVEMLRHIFGFFTLSEQLKLATVSRRWQQAIDACLASRRYLSKKILSGRYYMSNDMLEKILPRLPGLHKIDTFIGTDLDVDLICRHCPQLREICLYYARVNLPLLKRLCSSCPNLTKLTLPDSCDDACVETVIRGLPQLRSLEISLKNIMGQCLSLLPTGLQCLKLYGDWNGLCLAELDLASRCPALKELVLFCHGKPSVGLVKLLDICPQLERLNASEFYLSDTFLRQLPDKTPGIQHLNLANCSNVTAAGLKHLRRLKELRSLDLFSTDTTDDVLKELQGAPHLTELTVGLEANRGTLCSEEAVARLVISCPSLKIVHLAYGLEVSELFELLNGQLSADRDVRLMVDEGTLENLEEMEFDLPEEGPLRVVAYKDEE